MKPDYGVMTYRAMLPVDPKGWVATLAVCLVAEFETECGYPNCHEMSAGAAVHPSRGTKEPESLILPVCERHKGWEYAKAEGTGWDVLMEGM